METKQILTRGIEIVTFLFAAFGHFLLDLAPPEEGSTRLAVGIASFLTLGVLLYVSVLARTAGARLYRKTWFVAAAALLIVAALAVLFYRSSLLKHTFAYPEVGSPNTYTRGTELTAEADAYLKRNPQQTVQDLVANFGGVGKTALVWTEASLQRSSFILTVQYLIAVLSLSTAIFCLTEGFGGTTKTPVRSKVQLAGKQ